MLCDFYELTMGNDYYRNGFYKRNVYFDVFFRNVPDGGGFAIAAGHSKIIHDRTEAQSRIRNQIMSDIINVCDKPIS